MSTQRERLGDEFRVHVEAVHGPETSYLVCYGPPRLHPSEGYIILSKRPEESERIAGMLNKAADLIDGFSKARERRLFEALYALAKAAEALDGDWSPAVWENLRAALVEANEALAYPTTPDAHAPPGQAVPSDP